MSRRRRSLSLIPYRVIICRNSSSIPAKMLVLVGMRRSLLLAGLVNRGALGNTIIVALPDDVGVRWERKQAFDRFPTTVSTSNQQERAPQT